MSLKPSGLYRFEDFQIDLAERTLWHGGDMVALAPKVIETLCVLVENHGRLMTKNEMIDRLWADTCVEERNLTQNIFILRKTLGEDADGRRFIETVPRRGYRFVAEVCEVESRSEVVQIDHSRQHLIGAEGYASDRELIEVVRSISKDLLSDGRQESSGDSARSVRSKGKRDALIPVFILAVLAAGAAIGFTVWSYVGTEGVESKSGSAVTLSFQRLTDSGKAFSPAVSPDKQFVAYAVHEQGLYGIHLKHLVTGSINVTFGPTDVEIDAPFFSADGNYVYYRGAPKTGNTGHIYRIPLFGGTPQMVASDVRSLAALSPDGKLLAFFRYNVESNATRLIVCENDGSSEKVITARSGKDAYLVWGYGPFWSPDSKRIGAVGFTPPGSESQKRSKYHLVEIDLQSRTEKMIPTPDWNRIYRTVWMPDGKSLMAVVQDEPQSPFQIWRITYPEGVATRITNDMNDYRSVHPAPDGSFLLATQERKFFNLWVMPVNDPSQARQLTSTSELKYGFYGLEWTPDGAGLVYPVITGTSDSNLWVMNVETLEPRQLTFDSGAEHRFPNVTPDGKSVIFASNRTGTWHIWQVSLDGSDLRQIVDEEGEFFPSVTPDGKWLFYSTPGDIPTTLWKRPLPGEGERIKVLDHAAATRGISPDSKQMVLSYMVTEGEDKLAYKYGIIDLERGGQPKDIGFNPESIDWASDGSGFYYVKRFGAGLNNIWHFTPATGAYRQITDFRNHMRSLSLSPDGKTLATSQGLVVSNVFKIDL